MTLSITGKNGFLAALVVEVRLRSNYTLVNSYFSDYLLTERSSSNGEKPWIFTDLVFYRK